jgi:hypothetical protein
MKLHLLLEDELLRLLSEGRLQGLRHVHGARRDGPVGGGLRLRLSLRL